MIQGMEPSQYTQLKSAGYSDQEIMAALSQSQEEEQLKASMAMAQAMGANDPRINAQQSMFDSGREDNLIKWQLELDSILERIEHILRGDRITYENGHVIWKPVNAKDQQLNDYGVSEILKIISSYLNRNTILSNYDEETINYKVYDLGNEVSDLIFMKYEAMGLDTVEKRKLYPILVRIIIDMAHSSYLRALHGGERDSLREARQISQTEAMFHAGGQGMPGVMPRQERSHLNPLRYLGGKFK